MAGGSRKAGHPPPNLSRRSQSYLSLIAERLAAAESPDASRDDALKYAQEAIGFAAMAVANHLNLDPRLRQLGSNAEWLAALRFLEGAGLFREQLGPLIVALTDMDRGIPALKPTGNAQGGAASAHTLMLQSLIIEMADEVTRRHNGSITQAEAIIEDHAAIAPSTLRRWRRKVGSAAPELRPRSFRYWMGLDLPDLLRLMRNVAEQAKKKIP